MKYPRYKEYRMRLESFKEWPPQLKQRPADLAVAGFYYLGSCDCVCCFFCGGCLRRWEEEDDPWKEHARWYPNCDFLKLNEREVNATEIMLRSETILDTEQGHPDRRISGSASLSISEAVQVDSRDPMDCPAAQRVLAIGYHSEMIVQAMQMFACLKFHSNFSATDLLNIIFEIENDEIKAKKKPDFPIVAAVTSSSLGINNGTNREEQSGNINGTNREERSGIIYGTNREEWNGNMNDTNREEQCGNVFGINREEQSGNVIGINREEQRGNSSRRLEDNRGSELNNNIPPRESLATLLNLDGEIRNQMICTICKNNDACIMFLSCCNILACLECAPALRQCPACKQLTKGTVIA